MDREQARFILQSLRLDGLDEESADFEEALSVAGEDSVLKAWLSDERKRDAAIAAAFQDVPVPPVLKEKIMSAMEADGEAEASLGGGDIEEKQSGSEAPSLAATSEEREMTVLKVEIAGGVNSLASPAGDASGNASGKTGEGMLRGVLLAGVLVVGAFASFELTSNNSGPAANGEQTVSMRDVGRGAVALVESDPPFELEGNDLYDYQDWLEAGGGPQLDFDGIPEGISEGKLVGCRLSRIGGLCASHLCFEVEDSSVHVLLVGTMPIIEAPRGWRVATDRWTCPDSGVAVVAERYDSRIWFFLSKLDEQKLVDLTTRR